MKQLSHILLATLLIVATSGVTISKHFCGNILRDVAILHNYEKCCDNEDMPMGCCHDEHEHYSVDEDYQNPQLVLEFGCAVTDTFFLTNFIETAEVHSSSLDRFEFYDPPPAQIKQPLYLSISTFLI